MFVKNIKNKKEIEEGEEEEHKACMKGLIHNAQKILCSYNDSECVLHTGGC